jgi:hypothetical protein
LHPSNGQDQPVFRILAIAAIAVPLAVVAPKMPPSERMVLIAAAWFAAIVAAQQSSISKGS